MTLFGGLVVAGGAVVVPVVPRDARREGDERRVVRRHRWARHLYLGHHRQAPPRRRP